jgi:hypothetical protein
MNSSQDGKIHLTCIALLLLVSGCSGGYSDPRPLELNISNQKAQAPVRTVAEAGAPTTPSACAIDVAVKPPPVLHELSSVAVTLRLQAPAGTCRLEGAGVARSVACSGELVLNGADFGVGIREVKLQAGAVACAKKFYIPHPSPCRGHWDEQGANPNSADDVMIQDELGRTAQKITSITFGAWKGGKVVSAYAFDGTSARLTSEVRTYVNVPDPNFPSTRKDTTLRKYINGPTNALGDTPDDVESIIEWDDKSDGTIDRRETRNFAPDGSLTTIDVDANGDGKKDGQYTIVLNPNGSLHTRDFDSNLDGKSDELLESFYDPLGVQTELRFNTAKRYTLQYLCQ